MIMNFIIFITLLRSSSLVTLFTGGPNCSAFLFLCPGTLRHYVANAQSKLYQSNVRLRIEARRRVLRQLLSFRIIAPKGTAADCFQAIALIEGSFAEKLRADRGYDFETIVAQSVL